MSCHSRFESSAEACHDAWTVWLTGFSGSGKSTLGRGLATHLNALSIDCELIDGDEVRQDLCKDLGFSKHDRDENVRRIGYVVRLLSRHKIVSIVAAISPYRATRDEIRKKIRRFFEIHVDCSLPVLAKRDVKGLYKRAFAGEIENFSGVSGPYEPPLSPDLYLNTGLQSEEECLALIISKIQDVGWLAPMQLPQAALTTADNGFSSAPFRNLEPTW
ncbi:MAG: adenylyl-sulfate kinase [Acidobacteriaceae bacterium]|nr:adenylyl-sulfate kinase [Acidobacteriaceae bacterium]